MSFSSLSTLEALVVSDSRTIDHPLSKEEAAYILQRATNPRLYCLDGFSISVQANILVECKPRQNDGPHTHLEAGFPSSMPLNPDMLPYSEKHNPIHLDPTNYTTCVYPLVPRHILEQELSLHGGVIKGNLTF